MTISLWRIKLVIACHAFGAEGIESRFGWGNSSWKCPHLKVQKSKLKLKNSICISLGIFQSCKTSWFEYFTQVQHNVYLVCSIPIHYFAACQ